MSELPRESLRRKRSARTAAVQRLYSLSMQQTRPAIDTLVNSLMEQWKDSIQSEEEGYSDEDMPDRVLLHRILLGATQHSARIDEALPLVIKENWTIERMNPVVLATLRCATYELLYLTDTKAPILLDEYVTIASSFTDNPELGFVHSALQTLARALRPDESLH